MVGEYSEFSSERTLQSRSRLSYLQHEVFRNTTYNQLFSDIPITGVKEKNCLPDGVYLVLDLRHGASTLDEILDGCKIGSFAMFEPLAVMKDEIIIVRRDYFGVDV